MLGHKAREFRQHHSISLEDLVPDDNFYRQVEQTIDLRFVREQVAELYSNIGGLGLYPVEDRAKAGGRRYQVRYRAQYCRPGRTRNPSLSTNLGFQPTH